MIRSAQKSGFTTIELLIVILIMGLMFGIGLSAYQEFNKKQIIGQTAKQIKNYLRLVQQKAMSGEMDCSAGFCGGIGGKCAPASKSFDGWFVQIFSDRIEYWGSCGVTTTFPNPKLFYEIPNTLILFPTSAPADPISFWPSPRGNTENTICLSGYGKLYKLNASSSGEIIDRGFVEVCP